MKVLKQNRAMSFFAIALIYVIATLAGVATYAKTQNLDWWLSLLLADAVATVAIFVFSVLFGNASVYDPYWSVQPPVILIAFALGEKLTALGVLLLVVVCFWAVRLTANWAYTFKNLTHQDWRYTMLSEKTGAFYPFVNFIGIHMVPTLVVYGCILPAVYAVRITLVANAGSILCLCLSLGAVIMQGIADIQMHKFRKNPDGAFIRVGLWKYARHPNYLGEILMWWGVGSSVVCASMDAWYLLAGAVANTVLFFAVSIPISDKKQACKDGFAEYKKQTRMLLPIKK